jgi:hypothetical protein
MGDPLRLLGRMLVATFRIVGYLLVFLVQMCIYLAYRRPDKVSDALGFLGRGVTDAVADVFRS